MGNETIIYGFFKAHRFLSNFYEVPDGVYFEGYRYPTVEHAYQAGKTTDRDQQRAIRNAETPGEAKHIGRAMTITRPEWDTWKLLHMEALLREKFKAGTALGARLVRTGDAKLVEANSWGDRFWGKSQGRGRNHLGELLMEIRDDIKTNYTTWKRSA